MNEKMDSQIIDFMQSVGSYIKMEYDAAYSAEFINKSTLDSLYEFIGSYYMGGSSVPDTARYVVEFIKRFIWSTNEY